YTEWIFFALMAVGLMRLRRRPTYAPAYRVWGYPGVPIVFAACSAYIVANQLVTDPASSRTGLRFVLAAPLVYYRRLPKQTPPIPASPAAAPPAPTRHAD